MVHQKNGLIKHIYHKINIKISEISMKMNIESVNNKLISIITIVRNDIIGLERTIQSVINQTYDYVEFIVIDGGSTDGTIDIINKYKDKIDYWVSEKDSGIYNAMNKGIRAANGVWVNFMNAGDTFYSLQTLEQVFINHDYDKKILIYGNKFQGGKHYPPLPLKSLNGGEIMGCHQSMFFNKELIGNKLFYQEKYKIYADFELVYRLFKKSNDGFYYVDISIAIYEGDGISTQNHWQKRVEKYKILLHGKGLYGVLNGLFHRVRKQFKGDNI